MADETITSTPLALACEVLSLIVMTGGIIALAHRAPHVIGRNPALPGAADLGQRAMRPGSF